MLSGFSCFWDFFLILVLTVFLESLLMCSQASWAFLSSFRPESSITEAACVSLSVLNVCLSNCWWIRFYEVVNFTTAYETKQRYTHTPLQGSRWCTLSCAQMILRFFQSTFALEGLKSLPKLPDTFWAPEQTQLLEWYNKNHTGVCIIFFVYLHKRAMFDLVEY